MEKQIIEITESDLDHYFRTLSNRGLIRQTRIKYIHGRMPSKLKEEFDTRINDLKCIDGTNGIYKFVAENASKKLTKYLDNFIFILKNNENSL